MNYHQKLQQVIAFIGQHLDEELSLDGLSDKFFISKFHFHRLFTAHTGSSLQQYIKWLRLKRASRQLIANQHESILNIAINAGFESHEAFSRAFKKACGLSPSEYRFLKNCPYWEKPPYCLPKPEDLNMKVEIRNINKTRLAIIEHRGDPNTISQSVEKLISWAKTQSLNLKPKPGEAFSIAYDDPNTTPPEAFRLDLGIKVPENLKLTGEALEKYLPAGRYAVTLHQGSRSNISDTVYGLYRHWLPNSGEQLGDFPCIFCYYNFEHEVAETEALTECWLLLK